MYLKMFGTDMVVLDSSEAIADLLDKKSAIYSDKVCRLSHSLNQNPTWLIFLQ